MIVVKNLTKSFDDKKVIDNYNVTLNEGRVTTLMGTSGCGKTTFAMILMGLINQDSGVVEGLWGKKIAAVFQEDRLIEHISAIENIKLVLKNCQNPEEIRRELAEVELTGILVEKPISLLSGGQKRRVAIVRAMMAGSDFICLDEPFKGLDAITKKRVMDYVKRKIQGKTTLFITHDIDERRFFEGDYIGTIPGPVCEIWPF
jgi:NitT/TauT family transport system ATP-binding protein